MYSFRPSHLYHSEARSPLPAKITVILILLMLSFGAIRVISWLESNRAIAGKSQLESQEILINNNSEKSASNQPNLQPVADPEQINDGLI